MQGDRDPYFSYKDGVSKRAIAKQLGLSRTSVIWLLRSRKRS